MLDILGTGKRLHVELLEAELVAAVHMHAYFLGCCGRHEIEWQVHK